MVVVPLETSITDATSQLLSNSISLRPQITLGGPPPQMAAFIKIVKSPEAARYLAGDSRAVQQYEERYLRICGSDNRRCDRTFSVTD